MYLYNPSPSIKTKCEDTRGNIVSGRLVKPEIRSWSPLISRIWLLVWRG